MPHTLDPDQAYYHRRCWEIYNTAPGLTCAAIARKVGISIDEVHQYLGWLPYRLKLFDGAERV